MGINQQLSLEQTTQHLLKRFTATKPAKLNSVLHKMYFFYPDSRRIWKTKYISEKKLLVHSVVNSAIAVTCDWVMRSGQWYCVSSVWNGCRLEHGRHVHVPGPVECSTSRPNKFSINFIPPIGWATAEIDVAVFDFQYRGNCLRNERTLIDVVCPCSKFNFNCDCAQIYLGLSTFFSISLQQLVQMIS